MGLALVCILVIPMLEKLRWKEGEAKPAGALQQHLISKNNNNSIPWILCISCMCTFSKWCILVQKWVRLEEMGAVLVSIHFKCEHWLMEEQGSLSAQQYRSWRPGPVSGHEEKGCVQKTLSAAGMETAKSSARKPGRRTASKGLRKRSGYWKDRKSREQSWGGLSS